MSRRLTFTAEFESRWPARTANQAPDRGGLTFCQSRLEWDQFLKEGESGQVAKPSHLASSSSLAILVSSRRDAPNCTHRNR